VAPVTRKDVDVLLAGGGPFGLMLANELGRRGIRAALFDAKPSTAFNPQANATQARTMEHYRRLGFADEVRKLGLPADYPTDIAYFTRYAEHELARFKLPAAKDASALTAQNAGSWNAAEPPHRVSQKYVERVLRAHAEALDGVSINFNWRLTRFEDDGEAVVGFLERSDGSQKLEVRARYLVGGDGPRSTVRRQLGIEYGGETGVKRHFFGGRMYAVYLRCPEFYEQVPHAPAWMYVTFNHDRRASWPPSTAAASSPFTRSYARQKTRTASPTTMQRGCSTTPSESPSPARSFLGRVGPRAMLLSLTSSDRAASSSAATRHIFSPRLGGSATTPPSKMR
jgi:2-polyprenyl-6-methoxyphenol hydroxylase-like FAD-dependent oxidoreductase